MREAYRFRSTTHTLTVFYHFRETLRETGPLRVAAVPKWRRMQFGRRVVHLHVCARLHGRRMQGRQGRVQAQAVRPRKMSQHARKLHVST